MNESIWKKVNTEGLKGLEERIQEPCSCLRNIIIPKNMSSLKSDMFNKCDSIINLKIPKL